MPRHVCAARPVAVPIAVAGLLARQSAAIDTRPAEFAAAPTLDGGRRSAYSAGRGDPNRDHAPVIGRAAWSPFSAADCTEKDTVSMQ